MKLQDLPSPYRELAEMRLEQQKDTLYAATFENRFNETNDFFYAFRWGETSDGYEFWAHVYSGHTPEIPASSLAELAEWQKSKEPTQELKPEPTLIGGKTEQEWIYLFAGQAMQGLLSNSEVGNQIGNHENMAAVSIEQAKALLTQLKKEVENA